MIHISGACLDLAYYRGNTARARVGLAIACPCRTSEISGGEGACQTLGRRHYRVRPAHHFADKVEHSYPFSLQKYQPPHLFSTLLLFLHNL